MMDKGEEQDHDEFFDSSDQQQLNGGNAEGDRENGDNQNGDDEDSIKPGDDGTEQSKCCNNNQIPFICSPCKVYNFF